MTKRQQKYGLTGDKISAVRADELQRFKTAVREHVVKPLQDRAAEQKKAVAKARNRHVKSV